MLLSCGAILVASGSFYLFQRNELPASKTSVSTQRALAPDFRLPQLDGNELSLSSYRGKIVLLDFWATWCDPCREETPLFVKLQERYRDRGLQIVGVSMDDSPDPVMPFYKQFHMNYPVVMGNANVGELYGGVLGLPIAFVIDRDGRIRSKHIGATDVDVLRKEIEALLKSE
jgi:cytochrome c biogenesis protein CcmG/thiol:disulfide interchange protein DsbE